jgi:hypothetical protein
MIQIALVNFIGKHIHNKLFNVNAFQQKELKIGFLLQLIG